MIAFVNCIQTDCIQLTMAFVAETSCAIDCFLLRYHSKVSTMSRMNLSDNLSV